jgi:hypothetical protein
MDRIATIATDTDNKYEGQLLSKNDKNKVKAHTTRQKIIKNKPLYQKPLYNDNLLTIVAVLGAICTGKSLIINWLSKELGDIKKLASDDLPLTTNLEDPRNDDRQFMGSIRETINRKNNQGKILLIESTKQLDKLVNQLDITIKKINLIVIMTDYNKTKKDEMVEVIWSRINSRKNHRYKPTKDKYEEYMKIYSRRYNYRFYDKNKTVDILPINIFNEKDVIHSEEGSIRSEEDMIEEVKKILNSKDYYDKIKNKGSVELIVVPQIIKKRIIQHRLTVPYDSESYKKICDIIEGINIDKENTKMKKKGDEFHITLAYNCDPSDALMEQVKDIDKITFNKIICYENSICLATDEKWQDSGTPFHITLGYPKKGSAKNAGEAADNVIRNNLNEYMEDINITLCVNYDRIN